MPEPGPAGVPTETTPVVTELERRSWVFRHPAPIRILHWINAVTLAILLMSGLQIFNAHPALYLGKTSHFETPIMAMGADGRDGDTGVTTILGHRFETTGILGVSDVDGQLVARGFPAWATLPAEQDLATGRHWHFLFAWVLVLNGLAYLGYGFATGQLRDRLMPGRDQLRNLGASLREHLMLRFPQGREAKRYNVIQKLSYAVVVLVLLPVQVLAGLAMSPAMNAATPFLLDLFGGRQSARTVHFVIAALLVLFVVVHVAMVVLAGFWNQMRGMVTGWFVIKSRRRDLRPTRSEIHR